MESLIADIIQFSRGIAKFLLWEGRLDTRLSVLNFNRFSQNFFIS